MEIKVNYLDNLRQEAKFDDFTVITDQPIRYKGDGSAPGPFDYFLASTVLCAAYFVLVYCNARDIPTENIRLSQNNIVDPDNRYNQIFRIQVELPDDISEKDRTGILRSIERCSVKRVIQNNPEFQIEAASTRLPASVSWQYSFDIERCRRPAFHGRFHRRAIFSKPFDAVPIGHSLCFNPEHGHGRKYCCDLKEP